MSNYTRNTIIDKVTGQIEDEYHVQRNVKKGFYHGPRKYWRVMELYDKAQLLLGSKVGILITVFLKNEVSTADYRISINATWLAEDIGTNRETVSRNIKKLVTNGYLVKEDRGKYFVNPDMFWIDKMEASRWQELKKDFKEKVGKQ